MRKTQDMIVVSSKRKGGTEAPEGFYLIDVDRPGPLGSPFTLDHESNRDEVCGQYETWLRAKLREGDETVGRALGRIAALHRRGYKIALQCWCAPNRCHADTIKTLAEQIADTTSWA